MQLYAVAGSKFYIGQRVNPKDTVTLADFSGHAWTEVDGWTNAGSLGDTQEVLSQQLINTRRVRKRKGSLDGGTMENQFVPITDDPGQIKFAAAVADCNPWSFKIEWGADCPPESVVTISLADPGVVTWPAHGFSNGTPIVLETTGTLPTGLDPATTYYVVGAAANTFSLAATPGGEPIETTSNGTGTHTAVAGMVGGTDMFYGLALPGAKQGGEANSIQLKTLSVAVDSNILEV